MSLTRLALNDCIQKIGNGVPRFQANRFGLKKLREYIYFYQNPVVQKLFSLVNRIEISNVSIAYED